MLKQVDKNPPIMEKCSHVYIFLVNWLIHRINSHRHTPHTQRTGPHIIMATSLSCLPAPTSYCLYTIHNLSTKDCMYPLLSPQDRFLRSCTTSSCSINVATRNGVLLPSLIAPIRAPLSRSSSTTQVCPFSAARCNGVLLS